MQAQQDQERRDRGEDRRRPPIQVIEKAGLLLDALASASELTAAELAEALHEPRSSVYRLLTSLNGLGMVEAGTQPASYRLGLKLFRLGSAIVSRFDERQAALPIMQRLHMETEETVFLCIRRDYEAVCIERLDGLRVKSMVLRLGGSLPLHVGASSRTLLAFQSDQFIDEYLRRPLVALTSNTTVDPREIRIVLEEIRRTGICVSDGSIVKGMATVSAPIFDHRGSVTAAISMSGLRPTILGGRTKQSLRLIKQGAAEISHTVGYSDG